MEAVRARALRATRALATAGIPYAVTGGNAVAAWVARVDRAAVRNTQDVDILVRRSDLPAIRIALEAAGFHYREIFGVTCFLDTPDSHPRDAIHLVFAGENVKPNDLAPTADIEERTDAEDFEIVELEALVRMKLTSYRDKDRTHLRDMIAIGLIDTTWPSRYPASLADRLQQLLDDPEG
ncbi:MAG: nucleotidyltransferase family protein [Pirellulales bacterium]